MRKEKRREREIMHNYMEVLAQEHEGIEPDEMSSSICKIYNALNRRTHDACGFTFSALIFANFLVSIAIFIVNLRWRKP